MFNRFFIPTACLAACLAIAALAMPAPAWAQGAIYAWTNDNYWKVGRRGMTGVAKYGWNLHDPRGKALPDMTYHFINDGYSDCKVFVAP
jgi:hypothetical protein